MLNFTLRQIEYFRAVALQGSISAAAEKERVSRSALAAAVSDLETALGCQLLTRQKAKGVVLTPFGAQLLEMSGDVIDRAERIATSLQGRDLAGRLGIGCFTSLGPTVVPALFDFFRKRHPDVTLQLHTGHADRLVELLRTGEIELAVGYGLSYASGIETEELYMDRMHVILPHGHRLASRPRVRAADLRDETLVLLDASPSPENVRSYFAGQGFLPKPAFRFQDYEVVRSLVARGIGYSIVIQRPASEHSYEGLGVVARPLDPVPFPTPVSCAWHAGRALTPLARGARSALRLLAKPPHESSLYQDGES
ncbi:LysR family transcriptional regulator [Leucobacter triazinivorans]|uniref:LysR family transcriptional regulator n=1 Tax=Leucobacter triazinivorans TaxID=1784719 RepID=UPI0013EEDC74|nr:LysR family transcriptional regulator [Leucobacter triazinivorans]